VFGLLKKASSNPGCSLLKGSTETQGNGSLQQRTPWADDKFLEEAKHDRTQQRVSFEQPSFIHRLYIQFIGFYFFGQNSTQRAFI
jgi:hypothetical protein